MTASMIIILLVNPCEALKMIEIPAELSVYQKLVGGTIRAIYPSMEEPIALPLNRPLFDEEGNLYDIIAGPSFVVGLLEDDFASLSPELIQKYSDRFKTVYLF